jgi:hypothetical protein
MRRRAFLGDALRADVPLALAREASAQREPPGSERERPQPIASVALHYMTWLEEGAWPYASTWHILDPQRPTPRGYRADDPAVFRRHNAQAARHGFVWLWSWWGRDNYAGGDRVAHPISGVTRISVQ